MIVNKWNDFRVIFILSGFEFRLNFISAVFVV
jgi:hypothetical protein